MKIMNIEILILKFKGHFHQKTKTLTKTTELLDQHQTTSNDIN